MKKNLIIAAALFFAASVTVLATTQNQTGKVQPQKATTAVKQEAQKPAVKAEAQKPAMKAEAQKPVKEKVVPVAQANAKEGVKHGQKMHKKHMEPKAEKMKPAAEPKK